MARITIPVVLYPLEDARQEMSDQAKHSYNIGAIRKAVRENKLRSVQVDDRTVVVTADAIQEYLRKYGKFTRRRRTRRS
jgi:hypothetical protein